jgi:hypothetical protein
MDELPLAAKVDLWRQQVVAGQQLTDDEYRAAVEFMRHGRVAASVAGSKRRAAKGPVKSGDELLDELDAI